MCHGNTQIIHPILSVVSDVCRVNYFTDTQNVLKTNPVFSLSRTFCFSLSQMFDKQGNLHAIFFLLLFLLLSSLDCVFSVRMSQHLGGHFLSGRELKPDWSPPEGSKSLEIAPSFSLTSCFCFGSFLVENMIALLLLWRLEDVLFMYRCFIYNFLFSVNYERE